MTYQAPHPASSQVPLPPQQSWGHCCTTQLPRLAPAQPQAGNFLSWTAQQAGPTVLVMVQSHSCQAQAGAPAGAGIGNLLARKSLTGKHSYTTSLTAKETRDSDFQMSFMLISAIYTQFQPIPCHAKTRHLSHCKKNPFLYLKGTDYLPSSCRGGKKASLLAARGCQDSGDAEFNTT